PDASGRPERSCSTKALSRSATSRSLLARARMSFTWSDRSTRVAGSRLAELASRAPGAVLPSAWPRSDELASNKAEMSLAYGLAVPIALMAFPGEPFWLTLSVHKDGEDIVCAAGAGPAKCRQIYPPASFENSLTTRS